MNTIARPHKPSVLKRLKIGEPINIGIAHTYERDYGWSDYSESTYTVCKISGKFIIGRNVAYPVEMISISREDLDSGRFEIRN